MKILFYDAKNYDRKHMAPYLEKERYRDIEIHFMEASLEPDTVALAEGYDAICAFVNMDLGRETILGLHECGVRMILMRCAGYNNVDLKTAGECGIRVAHVPGYSPESVAEHAMTLALTANRHIHKAYIKVRENNYSLNGLMGISLYGCTAGIVGTGRIGTAMARICRGFGMEVVAYDQYPNRELDFLKYVTLEELFGQSDLISLHCPLTPDTYHLVNDDSIGRMKDGVILVNTSRGGLIRTEDLIQGIRGGKFFAVGLDVYEEENDSVYEDKSEEILRHSTVARLLSFPNVVVTSHQGFFTEEAMRAISETTMENALAFANGTTGPNELI